MNTDTFLGEGGVSPGGLREKQEIKILICYILDKIGKPLKKSDITSLLQTHGLANYFESSNAFAEVISNGGVIKADGEDSGYIISKEGEMIAEELSGILPAAVKEKALKIVALYLERVQSEKENKVTIKKTEQGFSVNCKISDGSFEMLGITIYAPDRNAANIIKDNFYKDPGKIYDTVLSLLAESTQDDISGV